MMRVALSGGIASGKTVVSNSLAAYGVPIVDTDILAREVVQPGTVGLEQIVGRFGDDILDDSGHLDRKKLRDIMVRCIALSSSLCWSKLVSTKTTTM